eukprot:TRINITY_DN259_c1_g2_i1.p1 TRINITY_DN259_c1_g2~~TRINITY_DN259_c1_g2_i1.p1  ORF type:complete len:474 (-),score=130.60 TRINITY_DN259_c1_g2_i1:56-1477(-)
MSEKEEERSGETSSPTSSLKPSDQRILSQINEKLSTPESDVTKEIQEVRSLVDSLSIRIDVVEPLDRFVKSLSFIGGFSWLRGLIPLLRYVSDEARMHFLNGITAKSESLAVAVGKEYPELAKTIVEMYLSRRHELRALIVIKKTKIERDYDIDDLFKRVLEGTRSHSPVDVLKALSMFKGQTKTIDPLPLIRKLIAFDAAKAVKYYHDFQIPLSRDDFIPAVDELLETRNFSAIEALWREEGSLRALIAEQLRPVDEKFCHFLADAVHGHDCPEGLLGSYLRLDLPHENVWFVDHPRGIDAAGRHLLHPSVRRVGLDAEWKPSFQKGRQSRVSILQIATDTHVFIFDMKFGYGPKMESLLRKLFRAPGILKIGMAFRGDMDMLRRSFPGQECFNTIEPLVDVAEMFGSLYNLRGTKSLTNIVAYCTGKSLNKKERMSNWERRPLTGSQIHYAALDAFCMLNVVDVLSREKHS